MDLVEKIYQIYQNKFNGFFIDVGANDGKTQSNTFLLETKNNWKGILVEPSHKWYDVLKQRSNSFVEICALSNFTGKIKGDFDGSLMSSVNGNRLYQKGNIIEVECYTFTDLCKKHNINKINFCSIDVEGHELQVVQGIDFTSIDIDCFVIEVYQDQESKLFKKFLDEGYEIKCISNFNKTDNPGWDGLHQDYIFTKK